MNSIIGVVTALFAFSIDMGVNTIADFKFLLTKNSAI